MADNSQHGNGSWAGFGVTLLGWIIGKWTMSDVVMIITGMVGVSNLIILWPKTYAQLKNFRIYKMLTKKNKSDVGKTE